MDEQLQDLIIPSPVAQPDIALWLSLFLGLSLLALLLWRWRHDQALATTKALKKLISLEKKVSHKSPDQPQSVAIEINQILCEGFELPHLDQYQGNDHIAWSRFYDDLTTACYASQPACDLKGLMTQAKTWLKQAS